MLHSASLVLDDLVDGSTLRGRNPSVHIIYGIGVTINSAVFSYVEVLVKLKELGNDEAVNAFLEEARRLLWGRVTRYIG
jgi:geranylgeranyl pyrophosphate synthase